MTRGQQHTAEGDGGAKGATPRLRTRTGGARMPGTRAASPGGTREGRSGGERGTPRPGDPELKLAETLADNSENPTTIPDAPPQAEEAPAPEDERPKTNSHTLTSIST